MSNLYSGLSGVRFPEVVMNQGPLPGTGGLPAPLHDTPDSRINYGSTLLGDISPYAYGEPGYLSSQNAYLNIPHRIQKFIPALWLPEPDGGETFQISHGVDDGDIAFVMRLSRKSIFCSGNKTIAQRGGIGNVVDPFINLPTLNYLLAGIQLNVAGDTDANKQNNLWFHLLHDLDPERFSKDRVYRPGVEIIPAVPPVVTKKPRYNPLTLDDLIYIMRNCIKPFGIARGSEKQGGQSETTLSSVQWPAPAMLTMVLDGKDGNVVNVWHKHDFHAGDDLVLRFKPMPLPAYVLNHYYKSVVRKRFGNLPQVAADANTHVWQLVPDVYGLDFGDKYHEYMLSAVPRLYDPAGDHMKVFKIPFPMTSAFFMNMADAGRHAFYEYVCWIHVTANGLPGNLGVTAWQELGFWHIGRTQVMMKAYGNEEFFANDLANNLKTNHLELTFQPVFMRHPFIFTTPGGRELLTAPTVMIGDNSAAEPPREWAPELGLELLHEDERPAQRPRTDAYDHQEDPPILFLADLAETSHQPEYQQELIPPHLFSIHEEFALPPERQPDLGSGAGSQAPAAEPTQEDSQIFAVPAAPAGGKRGKRSRPVEGSLLRADGTTETSNVTLLS